MSDTPLQSNENLESEALDQSVQRAWDHFAMPDLSYELDAEHRDQSPAEREGTTTQVERR
ncbi:MAG TPA: hypothetical protein VIJ40_03380 [Acidimicrobiales bacterium]